MSVTIIGKEGVVDARRKAEATRIQEARRVRMHDGAVEIAGLLEGWMRGDFVAGARLKEAVSTSNFPTFFNQLVDQGMLGQYAALPSVWQSFASRVTVPDFRPQRLLEWVPNRGNVPVQNGGKPMHPLALPRVPELTEYPTFSLEEQPQQYGIAKYGERFPFSWEVWRNDEFNVIQQMPGVMARTAIQTEDILATQVLAQAGGPNPDFFDPNIPFGPNAPAGNYLRGNGDNVVDNNPLTVFAVERAIEQVGLRQVNGNPVTVQNWTLVVPPSLEFTALRVASIASFEQVTGDPSAPGGQQRYILPNLVSGRFTVVVNPWLSLIDQSDTAATTWYMVPTGGSDGTRQAIILAFLAGEETPDLRISNLAGNSIGGGTVDEYRGSFSHDDVQFRVRHVLGAAGLNTAPVIVSLGNSEPIES